MQFDLGSASIVKNRDFISIASRSYIKVIYDSENWLSLDVTDKFLGDV